MRKSISLLKLNCRVARRGDCGTYCEQRDVCDSESERKHVRCVTARTVEEEERVVGSACNNAKRRKWSGCA